MERAMHHRAVFRAALASVIFGLLSGIMFVVFYNTDLKACLLVTHLLGTAAFGLGISALLHVPAIGVKERILAVAGMLFGAAHLAVLGLLLSFAARI